MFASRSRTRLTNTFVSRSFCAFATRLAPDTPFANTVFANTFVFVCLRAAGPSPAADARGALCPCRCRPSPSPSLAQPLAHTLVVVVAAAAAAVALDQEEPASKSGAACCVLAAYRVRRVAYRRSRTARL